MALLEAASGGTGWPAGAWPSAPDELPYDDQGRGQEEVEVDDRLGFLSAATQLAGAVDPAVHALHHPAAAHARGCAVSSSERESHLLS